MTFGQKLKEIRRRLGLSQENLAEIVHVSRQAITKWENDGGLPESQIYKNYPKYLEFQWILF